MAVGRGAPKLSSVDPLPSAPSSPEPPKTTAPKTASSRSPAPANVNLGEIKPRTEKKKLRRSQGLVVEDNELLLEQIKKDLPALQLALRICGSSIKGFNHDPEAKRRGIRAYRAFTILGVVGFGFVYMFTDVVLFWTDITSKLVLFPVFLWTYTFIAGVPALLLNWSLMDHEATHLVGMLSITRK